MLIRTGFLIGAIVCAAATTAGAAEDVRQARIGVPYDLQMEGNPGTGYVWQYDPAGSDNPELVDVTTQGYAEPETRRPGAPAVFIFTVTPLAAGAATLAFRYLRPWETEPVREVVHQVEIVP